MNNDRQEHFSKIDFSDQKNLSTLKNVEERVLWLSTRMIDWANRRDDTDIKVGGHQASSASMVSIMTALWFAHINGNDKVAVKPHASPVFHAIKYLTGELDKSYLYKLREYGGLQAYPSRTKDPDVFDYSTGSVGLGAVAPLFSAATNRYVRSHFGGAPPSRFISVVGDAELDEGNIWEAICDPITQGLSNFTMIVDLNRQSLDRVVPDMAIDRLKGFFLNAGSQVLEVKYGRKLMKAFEEPGGDAIRNWIDSMPNEKYQSLFSYDGTRLRQELLESSDAELKNVLDAYNDLDLRGLVTDLGGHDLGLLIETFKSCDEELEKPSVVFAYTIKGWGLPMAGHPLNHSALMSTDQIDDFRSRIGLTLDSEWDRFSSDSSEGELCDLVGSEINNVKPAEKKEITVPHAAGSPSIKGNVSTQQAFGRTLLRLSRDEDLSKKIVTVAPDVATSTNLSGWINKNGVFSHFAREDFTDSEEAIKWVYGPEGQHIELGISEMNLFLLLGQLGLSHEHHGEQLLPIGTVYDCFIPRGLDGLIYSLYNDSNFIIVGTPSGVSLAPEGGAHQSTITPSIGLELPGLVSVEPAFATETDWLLCEAIRQLMSPNGKSFYLRLSTRPIDQSLFSSAVDNYGVDDLHKMVLKGGYRLLERNPSADFGVNIVTTGVTVPEAVSASEILAEKGIGVTVIQITSPNVLYSNWKRGFSGISDSNESSDSESYLHKLIPKSERKRPVISVHDSASHSLSWIGSALGTVQIPLGVDRFGESGRVEELFEAVGISTDSLVETAISLRERASRE